MESASVWSLNGYSQLTDTTTSDPHAQNCPAYTYMAYKPPTISPSTTVVPGVGNAATDLLPASYHYHEASGKHQVADPEHDISAFLQNELSLGRLDEMLQHLWLAGAKQAPKQLHAQVAVGREIVVVDRMDLHLVLDYNRSIFLKPIPRLLLDSDFWQNNLECPFGCMCLDPPAASCRANLRKVALGFLYTYVCLISTETDFFLAHEKRLLPRKAMDSTIEWAEWKATARELLREHKPENIHPRFLRAELRLSWIDWINRFTHFPSSEYIHGYNNYTSFYRENFRVMTALTVFLALVLSAMQVGLSTEVLQASATFQTASVQFTLWSILWLIFFFGFIVFGPLLKFFIADLPAALRDK